MRFFKDFFLLNEISEETILYHRSEEALEPGQILIPTKKHGESHWLKKIFTERVLEKFRQKYAPDKLSRFNCIFCSVVPRSVFLGKGQLYEVKPIGNFYATMAYYINAIGRTFDNVSYSAMSEYIGEPPFRDRYRNDEEYLEAIKKYEIEQNSYRWFNNYDDLLHLFNLYWNTNVSESILELGREELKEQFTPEKLRAHRLKTDPKWIEVLCEKVQVVRKVEEEMSPILFKRGDRVVLLKDIENNFYGYTADGNTKLPEEEVQKIVKSFNGVPSKYNDYTLKIPEGTQGVIVKALLDVPSARGYKISGGYQRPMKYRFLRMQPDGYNFGIDLGAQQYKEHIRNLVKKV